MGFCIQYASSDNWEGVGEGGYIGNGCRVGGNELALVNTWGPLNSKVHFTVVVLDSYTDYRAMGEIKNNEKVSVAGCYLLTIIYI